MAHFIIEYSANLEQAPLAIDRLFEKLHQGALDTGLFPLAGIRSRAHRCEHFRVADGNSDYGFVHLQVKIGAGRTDEEKQSAANVFFAILSDHLKALHDNQGMAISFEMTELPVTLKYNQNNLRNYLP
jgi:5-carboxymethyl-2-hydroxymuconate isomerase